MKFSQVDVIGKELKRIQIEHTMKRAPFFERLMYRVLLPRNPKYRFTFNIPVYLYLRAISFCEEISDEIDRPFSITHLTNVLYEDFLSFVRNSNNIHEIYKRLTARNVGPTNLVPYQTDEVYEGVINEEIRGYEKITVLLKDKSALRGEILLKDMIEIYSVHTFKLETVLEIIFCDFVEDYRKGLIKNPIDKVVQYL